MSKEKTPMQELIDVLKTESLKYTDPTERGQSAFCEGIDFAIDKATQLLEKQKQMVVDAWVDGEGRFFDVGTEEIEAEKYYNEKFNQA